MRQVTVTERRGLVAGRRSGDGAIGVALSVFVIAVVAGIALLVLSQAAPDMFAYLMSWFDRTF